MRAPIITSKKNLLVLAYLLAFVKFILPYLIQNSVYEPHRDEFLYLAEARHLAWGYIEMPPLISVFAFFTNLFGGSLFWIKFWPSFFGAFTFILVARLIILFNGRGFAVMLGFMPFVFGYFMHVHFMLQPNFLEMFFWTLMAYGLISYIKTDSSSNLYLTGVGFGLGMLSKYSVLFFAVSLLIGLLVTRQRKVLLNKHFYFAILLGLAIWLPNIIWQWQHGFPFIAQLTDLQHQQLEKVSQTGFLIGQLVFNLPCIFIWLAGLYWAFFTTSGKPFRFACVAILVAIVIIIAGHGKSYYGMPAYPVLFAFGAVWLEDITAERLYYLRYAMVTFTVITGCYLDTITLPFLPPAQLAEYYHKNDIFRRLGFLQWEDQKDHLLPQDFADMLSWKEMTTKTAGVYNSLNTSQKAQTAINCGGNYGEASAVDYYGSEYSLPATVARAANYILWAPPDFTKNNNFIVVTDYKAEMHEDYIKDFQHAALVDSISNPYAREYGTYIILLQNPNDKIRKWWSDYYRGLREKTSVFSR